MSKFTDAPQKTSKIITWQSTEYDPEEIFVPLIYNGIDCSPYTISRKGNILGRWYLDKERNILKKLLWSSVGGYMFNNIRVDQDVFKDGDYKPDQKTSYTANGRVTKTFPVHRAVAYTFIPKPVPEMFKSIWSILSEEQKNWIQSVYIVDHIDDNRTNPHADNLRWVTVRENNSYHKKQKEKNSS